MYRDTALIKKHITKVRMDDGLNRQVESLCDLTGEQKAVVVRDLILLGLDRFHAGNNNGSNSSVEVPLKSLLVG